MIAVLRPLMEGRDKWNTRGALCKIRQRDLCREWPQKAQKEQNNKRRQRQVGFVGSDPADGLRTAWNSCDLQASGPMRRHADQLRIVKNRNQKTRFVTVVPFVVRQHFSTGRARGLSTTLPTRSWWMPPPWPSAPRLPRAAPIPQRIPLRSHGGSHPAIRSASLLKEDKDKSARTVESFRGPREAARILPVSTSARQTATSCRNNRSRSA